MGRIYFGVAPSLFKLCIPREQGSQIYLDLPNPLSQLISFFADLRYQALMLCNETVMQFVRPDTSTLAAILFLLRSF